MEPPLPSQEASRAPACGSTSPEHQSDWSVSAIMNETVVVLDPISEERAAKLRALLPPGLILTHGIRRGDDHLKEIIAEAEYAIAGQVGVSGEVLRSARKLKLLHKWGVGV